MLGNAMVQANGQLAYTRIEGRRESTPDHVLISKSILKRDKTIRAGVLQGIQLNNSDHRQIVIEMDYTTLLNLDADGGKMQRVPQPMIKPKLYLNDTGKVNTYIDHVIQKWEEGKCSQAIATLEELSMKYEGGDPDMPDCGWLQIEMDKTMLMCVNALTKAEEKTVGKPRRQKAVRSKKKDLHSKAAMVHHRQIRMLSKLVTLYERRKYGAIVSKMELQEEKLGLQSLGTRTAMNTQSTRARWRIGVEATKMKLYRVMNSKNRAVVAEREQKKRKWIVLTPQG
jgi:hypothetical protein